MFHRPTILSAAAAAPALAALLLGLSTEAAAWRASLGTVSLTPSGPQGVELCHGTASGPSGLQYDGGWYCAAPDGQDTVAEYGDGQVWARASLPEGSLRLTATADGAVQHVGIGDLLWITVPGLAPGQRATLSFELRVDGGFARGPASGIGQAGFGFQAYSGVFSYALVDTVGLGVAWRTAYGSDRWNTTADADEFHVLNSTGDWTVVDEDHFRASIDIDGSDPTIGLRMWLSAAGPADFSHTATLRFGSGPPMTFVSESGVLLSAVPEPAAAGLLALGLAVLAVRRRARGRSA